MSVNHPVPPSAPVHSYAQLRAHHATALKYVIAKLRWEQTNNGYLKGEDAWLLHNRVISKLEAELETVETAQKGLDRFPNCYAATSTPKPHGPLSREQVEKEQREEEEREKMINEKLDEQFPFIKQLFIGPRTKQQAKNDKLLRQLIRDGEVDDLSALLPSENYRMLREGGLVQKKQPPKKPYQVQRLEREKEKMAKAKAQKAQPKVHKPDQADKADKVARVPFGPQTYEEHLASLPIFGPPTLAEAMLPAQREQRHVLLSWLRKPWPVYDEEAADLMHKLGKLALKKMEAEITLRKKLDNAEKPKTVVKAQSTTA